VLPAGEQRGNADLVGGVVGAAAIGGDIRVGRRTLQNADVGCGAEQRCGNVGDGGGAEVRDHNVDQITFVGLNDAIAVAGADAGADQAQADVREGQKDVVDEAVEVVNPELQAAGREDSAIGEPIKGAGNGFGAVVVDDGE